MGRRTPVDAHCAVRARPPRRLIARGADIDNARERERAFFDARAAELEPESMPPREYEPFISQFEDSILAAAGPLDGARVLDLGCGRGDLTLRLVDRGAAVTALDLSPALLEVARRRVERFRPGAPVSFLSAPAEDTGLDAEAFDLVVGKWVLHHLDLPRGAREIRRVLRPGGRGVFVETSALEPILRFARRRLAGRAGTRRYGTPDERPISAEDVRVLEHAFRRCEIDFPNVVFFRLIDRHVLVWRWPRASAALRALDAAIQRRAPRLSRWSYYVRIQLER